MAYTGNLHGRTLLSPLAALAFPGFLLAFGMAVRGAIRRFSPDVIHAHWWMPAGWFASRAKVPYLITCHGSDVRLLERGDLVRRIALPAFRKAAQVTTVSKFLARDLQLLLPALEGRVVVAPMPVDVSRFVAGVTTAKVDPPRVLYAGNLVRARESTSCSGQ